MSILWIVLIGFVAGIIARMLSPGPNNPSGFILTVVLGIAGSFLATFIGQTIGWYRPDQGAGFIAATLGALIVLFIWNRLVAHRVICRSGCPRPTHLSAITLGHATSWRDDSSERPTQEVDMGLLDILNGMQNGPRGQRQPAPPGSQQRWHVALDDGPARHARLQGDQGRRARQHAGRPIRWRHQPGSVPGTRRKRLGRRTWRPPRRHAGRRCAARCRRVRRIGRPSGWACSAAAQRAAS